MITLSKEPLYNATRINQEWRPEELSEPFDLEAYCAANVSKMDMVQIPGEHTYTSHDGDETTQIIITDGTESS